MVSPGICAGNLQAWEVFLPHAQVGHIGCSLPWAGNPKCSEDATQLTDKVDDHDWTAWYAIWLHCVRCPCLIWEKWLGSNFPCLSLSIWKKLGNLTCQHYMSIICAILWNLDVSFGLVNCSSLWGNFFRFLDRSCSVQHLYHKQEMLPARPEGRTLWFIVLCRKQSICM